MSTLVIVASAARARIFEAPNKIAPLKELAALVNPQDRLPRQSIKGDKPGRSFDSTGGQRHSMVASSDPKEDVARRFARDVVAEMESRAREQHADGLCIVASPQFLGLLRENLSDYMSRSVKCELNKDWTRFGADRLRRELVQWL